MPPMQSWMGCRSGSIASGKWAGGGQLIELARPVRYIARWDGHTWEPLGNGIGGPADSFAVFNDGRGPSLFTAGDFANVGGGSTGGLAQWVGCPNCYANCDNSTRSPRLNVLDFMCFLNKFAARDPYANCTVDATIDMADFTCFMAKFAQGCP